MTKIECNTGQVLTLESGQVWTLKLTRAEELPPLVVLAQDANGAWLALPLIDDGVFATDRDVCLSEDPDWLNGQAWCAARDGVPLNTERLSRFIDCVPKHVFAQLSYFRDGQLCSLPTGYRLRPELGDPRIQLREELFAKVRRCATSPLWIKIREQGRILIATIQTLGSRVLEQLKPVETPPGLGSIGASAGLFPGLGLLVNGALAAARAVGQSVSPQQRIFELDAGRYRVGLVVSKQNNLWALTLYVPDAEKITMHGPAGDLELEYVESAWRMPGLRPVLAGTCLFTIQGQNGTVELAIELEQS